VEGFTCNYYKRINAIVSLTCTKSEFDNNVNNVRTNFIAAVAAAAKVDPSFVTINMVLQSGEVGPGPSRRLFAIRPAKTIQVHAQIKNAVRLHKLSEQLEKRVAGLHASHAWQHNHEIVPINNMMKQ
jgi:hypothetical protein